MFAAELSQYRSLLSEKIQKDMAEFSVWEKSMKQNAREEARERKKKKEQKSEVDHNSGSEKKRRKVSKKKKTKS